MKKLKLTLLFSLILGLVALSACGDKLVNNNDQDNLSNNAEGEVLSLGESAIVESTFLGDFEVTIDSFEIHENYKGKTSEHEGQVFMIVDFTVKNVGDKVLKGDEISRPTLFTENGDRSTNYRHEESITHLKEELQPGDKDSGQMFFETYDSDNFEINFGYGMTLNTDDVIWSFSRSEGK